MDVDKDMRSLPLRDGNIQLPDRSVYTGNRKTGMKTDESYIPADPDAYLLRKL